MTKTNFWNDAAKYGAFMAIAQILFSTAGLFWRSPLLSFLSVVVIVLMIYFFTRRRVTLYGADEGYSYGQCMKFIFWMACFSGILWGAWEIVGRNLLFAVRYEAMLQENMQVMATIYSEQQLELVAPMMRSIFFSPIWVVVSSVVGSIFQSCFFGLFISGLTRRNPDIFSERGNGDA